jgi:hypothetical protein
MSADLFAAFGDTNSSAGASHGSSSARKTDQFDGLDTLLDTSISFGGETSKDRPQPGVKDSRASSASFSGFSPPPLGDTQNEILFDAAEDAELSEEDEWGEFESAKRETQDEGGGLLIDLPEDTNYADSIAERRPQDKMTERTSHQSRPTAFDLLSQDPEPVMTQEVGRQPRKDITTNSVHRLQDTPSLFSSLADQTEDVEDWGEFTDGAEATAARNDPGRPGVPRDTAQITSQTRSLTHETKGRASPRADSPAASQIRPANIPPPLILLQLFPPLLEKLQRKCPKSVSSAKGKAPKVLPPELPQEAGTLRVMVRILLGRSLRWKRDTILSQSTKIGPARSGKAGGMKLSSVNKSESLKEDKEAVEVQETWKKRAGVLNSIVTEVDKPIPSTISSLQVRPATTEEGAFKAPHACALCGLKRDERITKVDLEVNDSFGEWWTDYWGHSECKAFWEAHSGDLDQRS